MKTIRLHNSSVDIPECWDDLTPSQYIDSVGLLHKLIAGDIDEFSFRLLLLFLYTGYRPSNKDYDAQRWLRFLLCLKRVGCAIKYRYWRLTGRTDSNGYKHIMRAVKQRLHYDKPDEPTRDIIAFNLVQLADMITFPLSGNKVNLSFKRNPLPSLPEARYPNFYMKKFDIGIVLSTNFSAGEFFDAVDISSAWRETKNSELLDALLAIIYQKKDKPYSIELVMEHSKYMKSAAFSLKFGAYLWICSISDYFCRHPYYSILYSGKKDKDSDGVERISLGSGEAIIHLSRRGYGSHSDMRNKNLIELMDIQLKELKEQLTEALAAGVKTADLCTKTGLSYEQIQLLS